MPYDFRLNPTLTSEQVTDAVLFVTPDVTRMVVDMFKKVDQDVIGRCDKILEGLLSEFSYISEEDGRKLIAQTAMLITAEVVAGISYGETLQ